jgi:hypothetical protein
MTRTIATIAALLIFAAPAVAADEPLLGKAFIVSPDGLPACEQQADLKEYRLAMSKMDMQGMRQLKGCGSIKGGLKVVVEDNPRDGGIVKIRVLVPPLSSLIVYTQSFFLQKRGEPVECVSGSVDPASSACGH